jgi:hypothetical protein
VPFLPCSDVCLFSCFVFLGDNIVPSSHKSGYINSTFSPRIELI